MADWSLASVWNECLDTNREREYTPRDHIWASELSGSYYDRYWKMHGRKPTTPPNLRARRKFEAGNLSEWVVLQILRRSQLLKTTQDHITFDNGDMRVTGRSDYIAGGTPKLDDMTDLPEGLAEVSQAVIERLHDSNELDEQVLELKSCSGMMFERYMIAPARHHAMQLFHYAYNLKKPGRLVYLSRDDLRMVEWTISPDSEEWFDLYDRDISQMAHVYGVSEDEISEFKEPLLLYEDGKFKKNFRIEYSSYLTDYGYERPDEYAEPTGKIAGRINRVLTRIQDGKKLTKLNEEAIEAVVRFFPSAAPIIMGLREAANV